ncbi:MAG TPA: response regulator transcription factor, partial [Pyrinomonadaceae bacterium]|nr:response regulator transcription factor [Pyrinomonadaceae bacterium]
MKNEITLVIADDHPIFRQGLRQIIELEPGLKVLGEASDGRAALNLIQELHPDVAVLDVNMPEM